MDIKENNAFWLVFSLAILFLILLIKLIGTEAKEINNTTTEEKQETEVLA